MLLSDANIARMPVLGTSNPYVDEVSGPMNVPFTTSSDTVPNQELFGLGDDPMGYYSSLLKQRAMMAPQMTREEAEMYEQGPYYGMHDLSPETANALNISNRIAIPIWIIAGFYGDRVGNKAGSVISALAGGFITANMAARAILGQNNYSDGVRYLLGAGAAVAAFFTISDAINVFKKKPESPTFKTKLTRLSKAVGLPA